MIDPLRRLRDWTYENYHLAYLAGTAILCQSLFFPSKKATALAWLACTGAGVVLEPCVNPFRHTYGKSWWRLSPDEPCIALTFDDGPGPDTEALLDLLKELGVPGNFFCIGQQIEKYPGVLGRMAQEGHLIGNHTYSHPNLLRTGWSQTRQELMRVQTLIEQETGQTARFWRPPFGFRAPWTIRVARKLGLESVLWSINPRDFQDPGVEELVRRVQDQVQQGVIVLFHDGPGPRAQTLEAVRRLVLHFQEKGYRFVRLDQARVQ